MITVASYGGGRNSKYAIARWVTERLPLHIALIADTGNQDSEWPETYKDVADFSVWLMKHGVPLQWVRVSGEALYENSYRRATLPAIAFGFRTCSSRWKIEPQQKFLNNWAVTREAWARGEKVTRLIGFHAGEARRAKPYEDEKYVNRYPLVEWDVDNEGCAEGLRAMGLSVPPKSSCYFCPNMQPDEVRRLRSLHPELYAKAVAMELHAKPKLTTIKGLGKHKFAWSDLDAAPCSVVEQEMPCGCYDGE